MIRRSGVEAQGIPDALHEGVDAWKIHSQ
jgi:hypothetical protein